MQLRYIIAPALATMLLAGFISCSKSSDSNPQIPITPVDTTPVVTNSVLLRTDSHFGSVMTNADGKTLYFFSPDAKGNSACTGGCITVWPVFYTAKLTVPAGLDTADFKTITRTDGVLQTTYKGWPLYTYAVDAAAGDVNGDGVGKIWFVAKPDYTVLIAETQLVGNDGVLYDSTYHAATGSTLYMTDDRGLTLYSFSVDKNNTNHYTKSDFSNDAFWPIVQLANVQNVPSTLNKADFGSITVFTKPQLTYKGWPVYHFGPDSLTRGNTKGISVPTPGIWPVMNSSSPVAPQ